MHAAKQIRDALTLALTGLPTTGDSVGDLVWAAPTMPAIRVLMVQELIPEDRQTIGRPIYTRIAEYDIEIRVQGADYQDQIDQIRFEVEQAIELDASLGLTGVKIQLVQTGPGESDVADIPQSFMPMRYAVEYRTTADDPGTLID